VFAAILALTVDVIAHLEFPRTGLIRVDAADQVLIELPYLVAAWPGQRASIGLAGSAVISRSAHWWYA
jgi:hypothetical protein